MDPLYHLVKHLAKRLRGWDKVIGVEVESKFLLRAINKGSASLINEYKLSVLDSGWKEGLRQHDLSVEQLCFALAQYDFFMLSHCEALKIEYWTGPPVDGSWDMMWIVLPPCTIMVSSFEDPFLAGQMQSKYQFWFEFRQHFLFNLDLLLPAKQRIVSYIWHGSHFSLWGSVV